MINRIISFSFLTLFFFTPLFFLSDNSELFEFNKMRLVYGLTVVIVTSWLLEMLQARRVIFRRTPIDLVLLLFLLSQIISTITSIDMHTSIWGYYSRSNGGLLSIVSYILLYYAFVSHYQAASVIKFIKAALFGGLAVSLYAIPEHFGFSPSCLLLTGDFGVSCWVQDVQARVFASLGQPNWLAAYLAMLIFPVLYFYFKAPSLTSRLIYFLMAMAYYLAFTFTFSRGGFLGFGGGLVVFLVLFGLSQERFSHLFSNVKPVGSRKKQLDEIHAGMTDGKKLKLLALVVGGFVLINLFFGSAVTGAFRFIKENAAPARPEIRVSGTQLENGGDETGQIRLVVWQGAFAIFRAYPLFGSGVETFAYSYYQYRPSAHNQTSEWDFLYNKAHNEYLNYLATTGMVGFISYMLMILLFIATVVRMILFRNTEERLLVITLLAGYVSYLIQNFFGFSVVMIAVLFFLFPAFIFSFTGEAKELSSFGSLLLKRLNIIPRMIYSRAIYQKMTFGIIFVIGFLFLLQVYQNWEADTYYKRANDLTDSGYVGEGFNNFVYAIDLNRSEPLYRAELGFSAAAVAVSRAEQALTKAEEKDASGAAEYKAAAEEVELVANQQTEEALEMSPKNTSIWRTAIRTYYQLVSLDQKYIDKTIETIDKTISLAPTDPKLYFNKALVLGSQKKYPEAILALEKTVSLKPDYTEAQESLADFYVEDGQKEKGITVYQTLLERSPDNEELKGKLEAARK